MNVLAIETATAASSVALRSGERTRWRSVTWRRALVDTPRAIGELLEESDLGWDSIAALVVPAGPGSFTGLRVGAALAVALAETRAIGLHAVPTPVAVAEACAPPGSERVCVSLDARRGRRYAALCHRTLAGWTLEAGPVDVSPEEVPRFAGGVTVVGPDVGAGTFRPLAAALADVVVGAPDAYRAVDPAQLVLTYARAGVERP